MRATSTSEQKPRKRHTRYSLLANPRAVKVSTRRVSSRPPSPPRNKSRPRTPRERHARAEGEVSAKRARKSSPVASRKKPAPPALLPMPLQIGDRITNESGGRPHTTAGGKIAHARVRRVDQPASVVQRPTTAERMSSLTVTRTGVIMARAARASRLRVAHRGHARRAPDGRVRRSPRPYLDRGLLG